MNLNKKVILVGLLAVASPVHAGNDTNGTNGTAAPSYGVCSSISNTTGLPAGDACPTNYQYKTSAATTNCAAIACVGGSTDKSTCCQAGCVTTGCPANYGNKTTQSTVYCAGDPCSLADANGTDISTCCDVLAKCSATAMVCNATTHVKITAAATTNCAGAACVVATDHSTCCVARADCSSTAMVCNSTTHVKITAAASTKCAGEACVVATDHSTCCAAKPYCTGFESSCLAANQSLKASPAAILCSAASCTTTECCEVKAQCSSHTCTAATLIDKSNKATLSCASTSCTGTDTATCCDTLALCSAHTCGAGLTQKTGATACTGTATDSASCGSVCCQLDTNSTTTMTMCRASSVTCDSGDYLKQGDLDLCSGTTCDKATCCTTMAAAADAKVDAAASAATAALAAVDTAAVTANAKAAAASLSALSPGGVTISIPSADAVAATMSGGTVELAGISVSGTPAQAQTAMNQPDFKCQFIDALKIPIDCMVSKLTVTANRRLEGDSRRLQTAVKIAIAVMDAAELTALKSQTVCGTVQTSVFPSYSCPNSGVFNPLGRCANTTCVATATGDGKDGLCCSAKPLCTKGFTDGTTAAAGKVICGASKTVKTATADRCASLACKASDLTACCGTAGGSGGGGSGGDAGFAAAAGYAAALLMLLVQ